MSLELNPQMSLEELQKYKAKIEEQYANSLANTKKLNDIIMERLEKGQYSPTATEKTEKIKQLLERLSKLITEKLELAKSIESKHIALSTLYLEHKKLCFAREQSQEVQSIPEAMQNECMAAQAERDKALSMVKVLLATLKSSRMQSEENFHKLKYSADLLFHIMYKAEDALLQSNK